MTKDQLSPFLTGCSKVIADVVTHSKSGFELAASSPAHGRASGHSMSQPFPRTVSRLFPSRAFSWSIHYRFFSCPLRWAVLSNIRDICCLWFLFFHPFPRQRQAWQEIQLPCIVLDLPQAKRWREGPQVRPSSSF